jgi:CRISPR-associated protein Cmr2
MTGPCRLEFSIGPVQGFVAQSRRTRDLWASSFLLSHLAETAMHQLAPHRGTLLVPSPQALAAQARHDFGTLPNRFIANFTDTQSATQAAQAAAAAVRQRWQAVADAVWTQSLEGLVDSAPDLTAHTRVIWDRQVLNFWELSWVVASPTRSSHLQAARKNWRTSPATVEPGDHCTMMHDRQELSGWIRSVSRDDRTRQDHFWATLREKLGQLDLADDERLCAIALIKRLFPKTEVQKQLFPDRPKPIAHTNWPSTAFIAAIPWLKDVASNSACQNAAAAYADSVQQHAGDSFGERHSKIPALAKLRKQGNSGRFLELDGNFFQKNALANPNVTPLKTTAPDSANTPATDATTRQQLAQKLTELCRTAKSHPSPFYALLLMDGDSMGRLLAGARDHIDNGETSVSDALHVFSTNVSQIVGNHLGVTIYAGGDDVLAMLPIQTALACAMQLADEYRGAFMNCLKNETISRHATLSGALVYAHYRTPLQQLQKTAHHLLDNVAKDATGRDSLAIAVYKSSGITAQWAAPWDHIRTQDTSASPNNIIDAVLHDINGTPHHPASNTHPASRAEFSTSFLYNVRERFSALTDSALTCPGEFGTLAPELTENNNDLLTSVLLADFLRGKARQHNAASPESARTAIQQLLKLCQRVTRSSEAAAATIQVDTNTLGIDGALLVRFLASEASKDAE